MYSHGRKLGKLIVKEEDSTLIGFITIQIQCTFASHFQFEIFLLFPFDTMTVSCQRKGREMRNTCRVTFARSRRSWYCFYETFSNHIQNSHTKQTNKQNSSSLETTNNTLFSLFSSNVTSPHSQPQSRNITMAIPSPFEIIPSQFHLASLFLVRTYLVHS